MLNDKPECEMRYLARIAAIIHSLCLRPETIHHRDHRRLEFYFAVEAVAFDRFLCMLMLGRGLTRSIRIAVSKTMAHMWSRSVEEIFEQLCGDKVCPGAYDLLLPHFEEIKELVEAERQALR